MRVLFCWGACCVVARSERYYDDVDEMRAFMSMFVELVGMFGSDIPTMPNGCGPGCKGGHTHVPPGESERANENDRNIMNPPQDGRDSMVRDGSVRYCTIQDNMER